MTGSPRAAPALEIERFHPARLTDHALDVAVVIDVLRATTTAIVLLERGVSPVRIVATPADLGGLPIPPAPAVYLVFSELSAAREAGLEAVDNSPYLAGQVALDGRRPVLVTTNGTRALAAAARSARQVLVAGFVNLSAVAAHLRARGGRVALLPAGDFAGAESRTEDDKCADALEQVLRGGPADLTALVADCRADARVQRRIARHPELERDVDVALDIDRCRAIGRGVAASDGGIELVRADRAGGPPA